MLFIAKYIGTISKEHWSLGAVKRVMARLDVKCAIVGDETGKGGFGHYQFAIHCSGDLEQYARNNYLGWHVEVCSDWDKSQMYCRKDGRAHEFGNTVEQREYQRIRRRESRPEQLAIIDSLEGQNDREITIWIDRDGGLGKSTLLYLMARGGQVFPIPRAEQSATRIIDYIAMCYEDEPIIALDLPRKAKVTDSLCEVLEDVKDGLIASAKYQGRMKFIRGVKVLVFTNQWIDKDVYKSLTADRWDIWIRKDGQFYKKSENDHGGES